MSVQEINGNGAEKLTTGEQLRKARIPDVSPTMAKSLASHLYGFHIAELTPLESYFDKTYKLVASKIDRNDNIQGVNQHGYVLKIINFVESSLPKFYEAQFEMMDHMNLNGVKTNTVVRQKTGGVLSRIALNGDGSYRIEETGLHLVYALEYIPGSILKSVPCSAHLMFSVGDWLGRTSKALKTFSHPGLKQAGYIAETYRLENTPYFRTMAFAVDDEGDRRKILDTIDEVEEKVLTEGGPFQKCLLHGDFNESNIIVAPSTSHPGDHEMCGIIDMSVCHYGCLIWELAVGLAYVMMVTTTLPPIECAAHVLAGYLQHMDLLPNERRVLPLCVMARITQSLVSGIFNYKTRPDANEYMMTTSKQGWTVFRLLKETTDEEMNGIWRRVLAGYGHDWNVD